jgi:LysR family transcriptional regulator, hydrogen peroxide-inducible genes activator
MVASGYGCTILPELAVPVEVNDRQSIRVVPFDRPPPVRTIGLAWRRTSPRHGEFVAFGQVVVEALGKPRVAGSEREHALVGEVL